MLRIAVLCLTLSCAASALAEAPPSNSGTAPALRGGATSRWADSTDDDLEVALVTFGPGDDVHQYFGHNALLVQDQHRRMGVLYNFGMFGFGPDMLPRYLQGQLLFWTAATPVQATFASYAEDNRSIRIQELDLSAARRRHLADRLEWYVQPEHKHYRYHHYFNNCSTKLRDLINEALGGQLLKAYSGRGLFTFRGDTRRYTEQDPVIYFLLMLWMNDSMEKPIRRYDEAFLPQELERLVAGLKYDDNGKQVPLVKQHYTVFEAHRAQVPLQPSALWPKYLLLGLLLGASAFGLAFWFQRTRSTLARALLGLHQMLLGVVLGIPALVATLFLLTGWEVTHYNENLLIANALCVLSFPFGLWSAFGSQKGLRWLGNVWLALGAGTLLLCVLKLLPMFDQDVSVPFALYAPVNIGCALAHWALRRSSATQTAAVPAGRALEQAR